VIDVAIRIRRGLGPGLRDITHETVRAARVARLRLNDGYVGLLITVGGATLEEGKRRLVNDHRFLCAAARSII
jgi:hypothetical protein